jgi:hypothetical protein
MTRTVTIVFTVLGALFLLLAFDTAIHGQGSAIVYLIVGVDGVERGGAPRWQPSSRRSTAPGCSTTRRLQPNKRSSTAPPHPPRVANKLSGRGVVRRLWR